MCRVLAYLGEPVLLDDFLYKPGNSLVKPDLRARAEPGRSRWAPTSPSAAGLLWTFITCHTGPQIAEVARADAARKHPDRPPGELPCR